MLVDDADRLDGEVFERLAALSDERLIVIAPAARASSSFRATGPHHCGGRAAVILRPLAGDGAMFGLHLRVRRRTPLWVAAC